MNQIHLCRALAVLACSASLVHGEVRLHHLFTDHMVLQRGTTVPVWGWADEDETVTVEYQGQRVSTVAKDGKWMVKLSSMDAGPAGLLRVTGNGAGGTNANSIVLLDVAVGEVWVASGQSNMEWPLRSSAHGSNDIARSFNPNIRLFTVPKLKLDGPTNNVNGAWNICAPDTVPWFSAVAYYFARDLQKALNVPVGIIHTSWGGSPAEVWVREEVLQRNKEYRTDILDKYRPQEAAYQDRLAQWEKQRADARAAQKEFTTRAPSRTWKPAELYNGMIANIIPYGIKGVIWYQGESNAGRAWQYRRLFADMIKNWRQDWKRDFTFLEVQLAPFDGGKRRSLEEITAKPVESNWAELREAQLLATHKLNRVGMAVITDVGDKDDIHPKEKEPVGARLALLARKIAYRQHIVADGPEFKKARFEYGTAEIAFSNAKGLQAPGGELRGFEIAGEDRKFVWANARIEGDKVIVSSPNVSEPKAVRYGWADYPVVNLYNGAGLPATPFRTDDWPMLTGPKPKETAAK